MTRTHTYGTLEISKAAYQEIRKKLLAADYVHAIGKLFGGDEMLDMDEIALVESKAKSKAITTREFMYFVAGGMVAAIVVGVIALISLRVGL